MKKELDLYTELSNNELWLMNGTITSREAREVVEAVWTVIETWNKDGKYHIINAKAYELFSMLDITYVFWCRDGSYFEEDNNVLATECRKYNVPYDGTLPLMAVQDVWKKQGIPEDNNKFPIDYFVA